MKALDILCTYRRKPSFLDFCMIQMEGKFDNDQMRVIKIGLDFLVDVRKFADSRIPAQTMIKELESIIGSDSVMQ